MLLKTRPQSTLNSPGRGSGLLKGISAQRVPSKDELLDAAGLPLEPLRTETEMEDQLTRYLWLSGVA